MLKQFLKTIEQKQPISTLGMFAHTYYWLTSPTCDRVYQNPVFKEDETHDTSTAIYFIHGTADRASAFIRVAERLIKEGLPDEISSLNLLAFEQRYSGMSIEWFAKQLRDKIRANQHQRVILIAHSRGGLVAAYFAEYLAKRAHIDVVLTVAICSPFNGSYLAMKPLSLISESVKEMEPDSTFLAELNQKMLKDSATRYHFFIAEHDAIVPGNSGFIAEYVERFPGSLTQLERHGHLSIMSSHRMVSCITHLISALFTPEVVMTQYAELKVRDDYFKPDALKQGSSALS